MAKKKKSTAAAINKRIKARDKATRGKIVEMADEVSSSAFRGREISLQVPTRTRSNTIWNKSRGILQMGGAKSTRELFNLNGAKQFMQTCLRSEERRVGKEC